MKHETHALPAVNGYDVVSYFSGSPMKGTGTLASEHMGQTYLFSSEENKEMFD